MTNRNRWGIGTVFAAAICGAFLLVGTARAVPQGVSQSAQTTQPVSAADLSAAQPAQAPQSTPAPGNNAAPMESDQPTAPKNDRIFGVLPNYLTVENARNIPPLTAKQKYAIVAKTTFDPVEYPYTAALAGISQAENSEPGYGQGALGYAKRFGSSFADNTDENFWTGAIIPSLTRQDPRYYQLGKGSFGHRAFYALSRIFVTRTDAGGSQFNVSEIAGSAISSGISNVYHPAGDRTFVNTMSVWGTQVGWDTVALELKEFWPDIRRKYFHKAND
jgi:hypothetical protein